MKMQKFLENKAEENSAMDGWAAQESGVGEIARYGGHVAAFFPL